MYSLFHGVAMRHEGSCGNPPRSKEHEDYFLFSLRVLRFFVVGFHCFSRVAHCDMKDFSSFDRLIL
jgi:hypothetical protein